MKTLVVMIFLTGAYGDFNYGYEIETDNIEVCESKGEKIKKSIDKKYTVKTECK